MIEVRCFRSFAEAAFLRDQVNALNKHSARPDPFSTFEFLESFYRYDEYCPEGRGFNLWFLAAFQAGTLVGYLVLKQTTHKVFAVRTSMLGFLVTHDTDRPHLVAQLDLHAEVNAAIYGYILERTREWSLLVWHQQDTSLLWPPASVLADHRLREWPSMENCSIPIRWTTLEAYFGGLSEKFRDNITRQMRHLLAAGNVEWLSSSDERVTPMLFELYRNLELRSWKARASAHIGRSLERIAYVEALLDARQPMKVTIQVLMLDGVPVAGLIVGAFLQGLYALHIAYDAALSRFSPGTAIMLMGIRQAIEGRYGVFNLLSGFKYYKSRWLATVTETRVVQIYRAGSLVYWHRVLGDWKRWLLTVAGGQTRVNLARFNSARRNVDEGGALKAELANSPTAGSAEQEQARISALIAQIRKGPCDYMSTTQLTAVMPFNTSLRVR